MAKPTRRLGRGLNSLVSDLRVEALASKVGRNSDGAPDAGPVTPAPGVRAEMIPTNALMKNPFQPRNRISDATVLSLARSIERSGILQPIAVRIESGQYEIIAGERRWLAAKSVGLTHVPAVVREASDEQMLEFALIENIQREDLNAIDRANAYREFCTRFELSAEEVAARLGEDRTTVANYLRLLELPGGIRRLVAERKLSMGHARCLLGITDDAERRRLAESVMQNELSVRALEEIVRRKKVRPGRPGTGTAESAQPRSAHLLDLQRRFEEAVKTKVIIHEGRRKGTGRIVIEYFSLDDFDRIAAGLGVDVA